MQSRIQREQRLKSRAWNPEIHGVESRITDCLGLLYIMGKFFSLVIILNPEGALEKSPVHFMICVPFRTLNDELVGTLRYFTKDTNKDRITIYLSVYISPKKRFSF